MTFSSYDYITEYITLSLLYLYEMDVILLFDQYLLVKQQNDIQFIWLHYGIHNTLSHGTM